MRLRLNIILIFTCFTGFMSSAQEAAPAPSDDVNWISSITYDITGQSLSKSVGFFNTLGKPTQSQNWDVLSNKVWANQTLYDYHGRPAFQTLSAPVNSSGIFTIDSQFILDVNGGQYTAADFDLYTNINPPQPVSSSSKLGTYYWNNTIDPYQDNTEYPFSRTEFSRLNPGNVKQTLGGNKINGDWLQAYSFNMPVGQELSTSRAFGTTETQYDAMRITKTVVRDVHGVETVVFTDGDGNTIAAARSGNEEQTITPSNTTLTIKEQGFVDIHIPKGCTGISVTNPDNVELQIIDLTTEYNVATTFNSYTLSPGLYRVAVKYPENYIYNELQPIKITHSVNYYEYGLNYFDKGGRLIENKQPNSFNNSGFKSTYVYNSLGQLQTTTSPDEGTAEFLFRKDGQIRFSQNTKQKNIDEFSYTNYDRLGRPIESGVYTSDDIIFYLEGQGGATSSNDPLPEIITPVHLEHISISGSGSNLTYTKNNILGEWNGGFASQQSMQGNGKVTFQYGNANGTNPSGAFDVIIGFSEPPNASSANYTDIKYGMNLHRDSGFSFNQIRIYENGDYLRDGNNQILTFGTFLDTDVLSLERINGVIRYYRNNQELYVTADNFTQPLVVDTSFRYTDNAVHSLILYRDETALSGTNIHTLIDEQDGLVDANCKEQHFTLFDIADPELEISLKHCGIPTETYRQTFLSGNVSKTFTKNPSTTTTWYSYDVYGRVKFLVQNIEGLTCLKTIDYTYDPITGQVVEVDYQRHMPDERFIHKYEYNVGGQLIKVSTSLDNVTYDEQAEYEYNETGQLTRKEIAENLQGIDYVYNLAGQLKAINHPSLNPSNDPGNDGNNGFMADVFGLNIDYYNGDYRRTNTPTPIETTSSTMSPDQFNGNIKALEWQTQSGQASTYAYHYNKNNWLTQAQFSNPTVSNADDYKVSNITYDANGNIKTLKRNGFTDTNGGTNAMDDFAYNYNFNNNQLTHVTDNNDNSDPNRYDDLKSQPISNYVYNDIGQLVLNEQDNSIYEYNASGLVTKINEISTTNTNSFYTLFFQDYENVLGRYDGLLWTITSGFKRNVRAYQADQNDVYGEGGEYNPTNTPVEEINLPEYCVDFDQSGNPYESRAQFNFFESNQNFTNPYTIQTEFKTIKDAFHKLEFDLLIYQKQIFRPSQGSTTPNVVNINADATITLKQEDGTLINSVFIDSQNYTADYCDRIIDHLLFDFNATGDKVLLTIDIDNDGTLSQLSAQDMRDLHQSAEVDNIHLQVANAPKLAFFYSDRGHRVRKEVYGASNVINKTIYVRDVAGSPLAIYSHTINTGIRTVPVLDENPVYGESRIGVYYRAGKKDKGSYVYQLTDHLGNVRAVILKSGSNAISLTNKTDYYPFGMPMPNRNVEGDYRYKYQGQEKDPETGMEAFEARLWDNRIGRWLTIDPAGQFYSSYLGMGNNPINGIDPNGEIFIIHYIDKKTGKPGTYEFGKDVMGPQQGGDNPYVQAFIEAYEYNVANGGGQNLTEIYNSTDIEVAVQHSSKNDHNFFDLPQSSESSISWNQYIGLETSNGSVMSPATLLEHEAGHIIARLGGLPSGQTEPHAFAAENCTARCNGEIGFNSITRTDHDDGLPVKTFGPTSNRVNIPQTLDLLRLIRDAGYYNQVKPVNLINKYEEVSRSPRYH